MSETKIILFNEFEIEDGELIEYSGSKKYVTIPDGVNWIGDQAFEGCEDLVSVIIPGSVVGIGLRAFSECENLTNVVMTDSISQIENAAFAGCHNLKFINIPQNASIGNGAFHLCKGLADSQGWIIFNGICFDNVSNASELYIPSQVKTVSWDACSDTINLKSVIIPTNVTKMCCYAFQKCKNLESVIFLNDFVDIEDHVFAECDFDRLVIYAHPGSTAEQYAINNGIKYSSDFPCSEIINHTQIEKVIDFKNFVNIKNFKEELDNGKVSVENLKEEELVGVSLLYSKEIAELNKSIAEHLENIDRLKKENESLRKLLAKRRK